MAIRLYLDSACTQEITASNPDAVHKAVPAGDTLTDELRIYVKSDDANLTYENIVLTGSGDTDGANISGQVDVQYAADDSGAPGAYVDSLSLAAGTYTVSKAVWRKVIAPAMQSTFNRVDIDHLLSADEYLAA